MSRIYDISRPLARGAWAWPGDRAFESSFTARIRGGSSVNVGHVAMSCHTGTHMDAPFHFSDRGPTAESIPLEHCIGPCEVVQLSDLPDVNAERVLVKATGGAPTVKQLEGKRLKLFGTDFHSVDPMDSRTLDAHHCLWQMGAVILEELDLSQVPDGRYQLIALPLKLVGLDAAPVRAVLVSE